MNTTPTTPDAILATAHVTYRPSILRRIASAILDELLLLLCTKAWIENLTPEQRAEMGIDLP